MIEISVGVSEPLYLSTLAGSGALVFVSQSADRLDKSLASDDLVMSSISARNSSPRKLHILRRTVSWSATKSSNRVVKTREGCFIASLELASKAFTHR